MLHLPIGFALQTIYLAKILNHRVLPESIARQPAKISFLVKRYLIMSYRRQGIAAGKSNPCES
jgi:hypothetical protein